jgi:hypothetical protein
MQQMKKLVIAIAAVLALPGAVRCVAQAQVQIPVQIQDKGYWRAASNTAASITGDIGIADGTMTLNFKKYPLASIRSLQPAEVSAAFDADASTAGPGTLYRLRVPASVRLLKHNTLCGTDDTEWMATYAAGKSLQVAFFSGADEPKFSFDAIANSTHLCGAYSFVR